MYSSVCQALKFHNGYLRLQSALPKLLQFAMNVTCEEQIMPVNPVPKKKVPEKQLKQMSILHTKKVRHRKPPPRKLRGSNLEIAERRQMVLKLRLKGLTIREIGTELKCGYMTITRDLEAIRDEVKAKVSQFDCDYALGKSMSTYEQIESEAWEQYNNCANGTTAKVQFLNLVRTVRNDQVKLLTEVGLIDKAPTQVQHQFEANQVLKGWTEDARRIVALSIIRAQMDNSDSAKALLTAAQEPQGGGNGRGKLIDLPEGMVQVSKPSGEPEEPPTEPSAT